MRPVGKLLVPLLGTAGKSLRLELRHKRCSNHLHTKAPPVYDPFAGGGSIPFEAQRLGLQARGSDLNPLAVLISKALVELPPLFANNRPVNPEAQRQLRSGGRWNGKGSDGLSEDIVFYGERLRDAAEKT